MPDQKKLIQLLGKVFDRAQDGLEKEVGPVAYKRRRYDFVFHMTDWQGDLVQLKALFDDPGAKSPKEATTWLIGFLYHVIPHLNTAGRLLLDEVPDPFAADFDHAVATKHDREEPHR